MGDEINAVPNPWHVTYRRLVKPGDLNPAHTLFGGEIMKWADEAMALYAMCQMRNKNIVTLKVSEILFKQPVYEGDFLVFFARVKKAGNTSMTFELEVQVKEIEDGLTPPKSRVVLMCDFTFVSLGADKKPKAHGWTPERAKAKEVYGI